MPFRRYQLAFVPVASIFLVLSVIGMVALPVPKGLPIVMPSHMQDSSACGDGYILVAEVSRDGVKLNGELKGEKEIEAYLSQFYRTKVERVLFVKGEPDITYQEVAQFIDRANGLVDHLFISILTPSAEREPCRAVQIPENPLAPWLRFYKDHGTFPVE